MDYRKMFILIMFYSNNEIACVDFADMDTLSNVIHEYMKHDECRKIQIRKATDSACELDNASIETLIMASEFVEEINKDAKPEHPIHNVTYMIDYLNVNDNCKFMFEYDIPTLSMAEKEAYEEMLFDDEISLALIFITYHDAVIGFRGVQWPDRF